MTTTTRRINPAAFLQIPIDTFAKHQIKIARSTLKMSDAGALIMGGMDKEQARAVLTKYNINFTE